jgi:hypothetical protein
MPGESRLRLSVEEQALLPKVNGGGRLVSQGLVQTLLIIERKVGVQTGDGVLGRGVLLEVDFLIFDRPPQSLYEMLSRARPLPSMLI